MSLADILNYRPRPAASADGPPLPLSLLDLHSFAADRVAEAAAAGHSIATSVRRVLLASDILRHFVGNIDTQTLPWLRSAVDNSYISILEGSTATRFIMFANYLLTLQGVSGFSERIARIRRGEWISFYGEFRAAAYLQQAGVLQEMLTPPATPGQRSPDLRLRVGLLDVECEVKTKLSTSQLSVESLRKTLSDAAGQFSPRAIAIVWINVQTSWTDATTLVMGPLSDAVGRLTRPSSGADIIGMTVCSDELLDHGAIAQLIHAPFLQDQGLFIDYVRALKAREVRPLPDPLSIDAVIHRDPNAD